MTIINLIARKSCSIYWRVSDTPVNLIRSAIVRGCESTLASILGLPVKAASILVSKHVTSPRTGTRTRIPDLQGRRWSAHVTRAYRYRMQQNTQHTMHTRVHPRCISADTRIHSNREASIYGAVLALTVSSMFNLYERLDTDIRFGSDIFLKARSFYRFYLRL